MNHRVKLVLIGLVFAVPLLISYAAYFFWQPNKTMNYGELISPVITLPDIKLARMNDGEAAGDGSAGSIDHGLRGKWLLLTTTPSVCEELCRKKLYTMRQSRTIIGREQDRVVRVMLVEDGTSPSAEIAKDFAGTVWINAKDSAWLAGLKLNLSQQPQGFIYAVDPLGNVFMRYAPDADIKKLVHDMNQVLKASNIG